MVRTRKTLKSGLQSALRIVDCATWESDRLICSLMKFSKSRRITRRAEFSRVRSKGKSISGRFLVMGYLKDEQLTEPVRLGLITTKRIGNAVIRNRVRRRLRGILQRNGDQLVPGYWMVLIARNAAAGASSEQLEKEWKWMTRKIGIFRPDSPES